MKELAKMLMLCVLGLFDTCRGDSHSSRCVVLPWGRWSACRGTHRRVRIVGGNSGCKVHVERQVELCGASVSTTSSDLVTQRLPAKKPTVKTAHKRGCHSPWGAWGGCSRTCGIGERSRTRPSSARAAGCRALKLLHETQPCRLAVCYRRESKLPCAMSDWAAWGSCSTSCGGGGRQWRYRSVKMKWPTDGARAVAGAKLCGAKSETRVCIPTPSPCVRDCRLQAWSTWGECMPLQQSAAEVLEMLHLPHKTIGQNRAHPLCGNGAQLRWRGISRAAASDGRPCTRNVRKNVQRAKLKAWLSNKTHYSAALANAVLSLARGPRQQNRRCVLRPCGFTRIFDAARGWVFISERNNAMTLQSPRPEQVVWSYEYNVTNGFPLSTRSPTPRPTGAPSASPTAVPTRVPTRTPTTLPTQFRGAPSLVIQQECPWLYLALEPKQIHLNDAVERWIRKQSLRWTGRYELAHHEWNAAPVFVRKGNVAWSQLRATSADGSTVLWLDRQNARWVGGERVGHWDSRFHLDCPLDAGRVGGATFSRTALPVHSSDEWRLFQSEHHWRIKGMRARCVGGLGVLFGGLDQKFTRVAKRWEHGAHNIHLPTYGAVQQLHATTSPPTFSSSQVLQSNRESFSGFNVSRVLAPAGILLPTGTILAAAAVVILCATVVQFRHNQAQAHSYTGIRPEYSKDRSDVGATASTVTLQSSQQAYGTRTRTAHPGSARASPLAIAGSTVHVPVATANIWSDTTGFGQFQFDI